MRRQIVSNRRTASRKPRTYKPDGWQDILDHYAGTGILYLVFTLTVILSWIMAPGTGVAPFWSVGLIYLWSFRHPHLLPAWLVFAVGFLSDIVIGTPLGVHAFALLGVSLCARFQQRFLLTQSFIAVWANFAAVSLLFSVIVTGMTVVAAREFIGVGVTFTMSGIAWAVLALLFPVFVVASHGLMMATSRTDR